MSGGGGADAPKSSLSQPLGPQPAPTPVSGVLLKWVNYLKGYQPRYFVLADGTLHYHKARPPLRASRQQRRRGARARPRVAVWRMPTSVARRVSLATPLLPR